jgi:hypothetical protein
VCPPMSPCEGVSDAFLGELQLLGDNFLEGMKRNS